VRLISAWRAGRRRSSACRGPIFWVSFKAVFHSTSTLAASAPVGTAGAGASAPCTRVLTRTSLVGRQPVQQQGLEDRAEQVRKWKVTNMACHDHRSRPSSRRCKRSLTSPAVTALTAPRRERGPTTLTGICSARRGKGDEAENRNGRTLIRYDKNCSNQGPARAETDAGQPGGCRWRRLITLRRRPHRAEHACSPKRLEEILSRVLGPESEARRAPKRAHIAEIAKRASDSRRQTPSGLSTRIENGRRRSSPTADARTELPGLKAIRDRAALTQKRGEDAIERLAPSIKPQALKTSPGRARKRMRTEGGGYRRGPSPPHSPTASKWTRKKVALRQRCRHGPIVAGQLHRARRAVDISPSRDG